MFTKPQKLVKISDEDWRIIPKNNKYQISNYGRVKSFTKDENGQIMKNRVFRGFKTVNFRTDKKKQTYYIHRLVAEIWLSKPSDDYRYVAHLDGNKTNNRVSNLAWMTKEEMLQHQKKFASKKKNIHLHNTKLKESDIRLLKSMLQKGVSQAYIAKMFCISEMQVTRIKRGENWAHVQI